MSVVDLLPPLAAALAAGGAAIGSVGLIRAWSLRGRLQGTKTLQREIDTILAEIDNRPASEQQDLSPAELEAHAIMEAFGRDLLEEAGRIAKRANAERPSKQHVRLAADRIGALRDRSGAATDLALGLGSILIGAAVSYQVNLWTGGEAAEGSGLWMTLTFAGGLGMVIGSTTLKWRRS